MIILITIGICVVLLGLMFWGVFWTTHREMTQDFEGAKKWHYGTFKEFWKLFNERKWERDSNFKFSFFTPLKNVDWSLATCHQKYEKNYIHAGIVCFDNEGFVFYPWGYLNFLIFIVSNKYKEESNEEIVDS